jgi:hypothetical protein
MMKSLATRDPQRRELANVLPRSHDTEGRVQKHKRIPNCTETTMQGRTVEPGNPGCVDPAPQNRGGTPKNEERHQAGTPATLEGYIDNTIDKDQDTGGRPGRQAYPARWLVSHYPASAAVAATIATKVDMRGAP